VDEDYTYVELTQDDYREMMAAGFNTFRVPLDHLSWVIDEPVWFLVRQGFDTRPDILYRSNFFGAVMYMDEPAIRAMGFDRMFRNFTSPTKAAAVVLELTRGRYHGDGGYGNRHLQRLLTNAGYRFGDLEIVQPDYPVWETVPSAAWYEMEAGIRGWCMEARYVPEWFAGLMQGELGVDFPADAESVIQFHNALFTGASRRFGAQWGVAIYGQTHPDPASRMWWSTAMETTDDNGHGATYGQVMAAAAGQAAELLRAGTLFDFVFLRNGEKAEGYDEVRRVLDTAEMVRE